MESLWLHKNASSLVNDSVSDLLRLDDRITEDIPELASLSFFASSIVGSTIPSIARLSLVTVASVITILHGLRASSLPNILSAGSGGCILVALVARSVLRRAL